MPEVVLSQTPNSSGRVIFIIIDVGYFHIRLPNCRSFERMNRLLMMFTCPRRIGDESALNCGKLARDDFENIHLLPLAVSYSIHPKTKGSAKLLFPGSENLAGLLRQKW